MELIKNATPPEVLVEHSVRLGESELLWLRPEPFAVRCEPEREQGALKLVVAVEGGGILQQDGRQAVLEEGAFTWLQSDVPFELTMARGRRLLLRMPAEQVRRRHPEVDLRPAVARGQHHAGERILARLLQGFALESRALSAPSCAATVNTLLEAVGLCPRAEVIDAALVRVERAVASIELRLGEPGLQPEDISREQGVSRRYLDGVLKKATGRTLADFIRLRRLERAAEDLKSRPEDLTAEVATRWGFRDASHFTRLFRQRYGTTPTGYRRQ
ncbi:helix-turn-helix domain-containing protein [Pyxidicoccus parkwayensis]|uniref:Helix-turn-helix domain-containing protein n=1 Tax=Pyxidicoccus parkwayensis TaxID=2813578 RepID=A0ABX7P9B9_9BACT|nr:helix-turn-helix domain-containing protein [Pyxidicoccus parkwaysis]QSQ27094.1 helix-turn-helix domain-containing protein [Pyxidicoccus parkwaysis]